MRLASRDLMPKRGREVDSRVSQETPILTTSNLVPEEELESQMRRRVALAEATGAASQTRPIREVQLKREMKAHQPRPMRPRSRNQRLRSRRRRKKSLRKKKLSSVTASMISSRQEL